MARSAYYTRERAATTLVLLVYCLLALCAPQAIGQAGVATPAATSLGADLSRVLQGQARIALERHLRPEEFQVFVTAVPNDSPAKPIPYLPVNLAPIAGDHATPESMAPLLKRVDVEVLIVDTYDQTAKGKLEAILIRTLGLAGNRGDKVTFTSLGLKMPRSKPDVERDLDRSEAEARDLRTQVATLNRERDDAKRDLSQSKGELDKVAREKANPPKAPAAKEDSNRNPAVQGQQQPVDKGFLRENIALLVGSFLILMALLLAGIGLRGAARTIGNAVQSIGSSIPLLGDKLGESLTRQPQQALLPPPDSRSGGFDSANGAQAALAGTALPMEAVAKRVLELHEEFLGGITEATEGLLLEHLSHLLDDQTQVGRAVATMELLGKERANQLYGRLSLDHQQKVYAFLKNGSYPKAKGEVMIEAGEALKSKLFGASFPVRAQLDEQLRQKLLLLKVEDLIVVAIGLDGDHLARLFLYLDPSRLGTVLSGLLDKDPGRFGKAASLVLRIPDVETATGLDQNVIAMVEQQLARTNSDVHGPYLTYYKMLIESVEDHVAENLSERFAATNPRIERFVRETIVTFGTFFKLHGDIQDEIIGELSNRDLAALVSTLREDMKKAVYTHVEVRQREVVEEELDRLAARGTRQVNLAHRAAKRQIVERILQIKGAGSLSEMLARKVEGLPAPAPSGNTSQAA